MLPMPNPYPWLAATAGGGVVSIAGVIAMVRIVTPRAASGNA